MHVIYHIVGMVIIATYAHHSKEEVEVLANGGKSRGEHQVYYIHPDVAKAAYEASVGC